MRVRSGWLALSASAVFGFTLLANEKPPESYVKTMKETNAAAQDLRKAVDIHDYDTIAKNAATLKTLFEKTQFFWEQRKTEDAIALTRSGAKAAGELELAAKTKNEEVVQSASKTLISTCKSCHDVHRQRLEDGTSEIK